MQAVSPDRERRIRELAQRAAEGSGLNVDAAQRALRERLTADVLRGEAPFPVGRYVEVRRQQDGEEAPNGEPFHVRIRASTTGVARDGGVVPLEAWEDGGLENFRKNPVVILAHRRGDFPLGLSVHDELDADEQALVSWWLFHEETEESRVTKRLYEGGWMRAASVGFRILAWHEPSEDEVDELQAELGTTDDIFWVADRAELVEESAVGVPADPDALTAMAWKHAASNARAHGIDVGPVRRRLHALERQCLDGDARACRTLVSGGTAAPESEHDHEGGDCGCRTAGAGPDERASREGEADVTTRAEQYLEEHAEALEELGDGDLAAGAAALAEAARGEDERDDAAGADTDTGADDGDQDDDPAGEAEHDVDAVAERVEALEAGVAELREGLREVRESVESLREGQAAGEDAGDGGDDADADADADGDDGRAADPGTVPIREEQKEDGTRVAVAEVDGEEVEVPLEDGETAEQLMGDVADRATRELTGAPVPGAGQ